MSHKYSTAIGLAAGAACAAFVGMGTAHADPVDRHVTSTAPASSAAGDVAHSE